MDNNNNNNKFDKNRNGSDGFYGESRGSGDGENERWRLDDEEVVVR